MNLIRATLRGLRWDLPATGVVLVMALLAWRHDSLQSRPTALWIVRTMALVLTLAALPFFDDPAARQIASVPIALARRSAVRLGVAALFVLAPVIAFALWAGLPTRAVLIESGALLVLAAGASFVVSRTTDTTEPSAVVSIAVLPLPAMLTMLPERIALLVPEGPHWSDAHQRWSWVLGAGVLLLAASLRDPAARVARRVGVGRSR